MGDLISKQAVIELIIEMRVQIGEDTYAEGYDDAACEIIDKIKAMPELG